MEVHEQSRGTVELPVRNRWKRVFWAVWQGHPREREGEMSGRSLEAWAEGHLQSLICPHFLTKAICAHGLVKAERLTRVQSRVELSF